LWVSFFSTPLHMFTPPVVYDDDRHSLPCRVILLFSTANILTPVISLYYMYP
jgi:hypothetical protein